VKKALILICLAAQMALALDPHKRLTQYSHRVWTQEDGLPQDTIRTVAQTGDGYLWIGTDEGLARFDGYEFTTFNKANGGLPSNSITALAAASDGSLWIGTPNGLAVYHDRQFRTYTTRDGLPENSITSLAIDHSGTVWIVAGVALSRFEKGGFTNFVPGPKFPVTSVRAVFEDHHHRLWVAGFNTVGRLEDGVFTPVLNESALRGYIVTAMASDQQDNVWIGGTAGVIALSADGATRRYGESDGLPNRSVRAIWCDHNGVIWAGTNEGLARFEGNRFAVRRQETFAQVRCIFEDREGDLWVGASTGLSRLRDDLFTVYGKSEGLPSDEPNAVFQDREGRIWVGFHDNGLMQFGGAGSRVFTTRDGLPNNEIFSLRGAPDGDLLIAARQGMARLHKGQFTRYTPNDPLGRTSVFDILEDSHGRIWMATAAGLGVLEAGRYHLAVQSDEPVLVSAVITLAQTRDGAIWAGTYGKGLWRVQGTNRQLFTTADGLSSDAIRSIYPDADGTLWIGTLGGGLMAYRNGRFQSFTQKDGLLSDNVARVVDDGQALWLSTTRGICRVEKRQLWEFAERKRRSLDVMNYGVDAGLRSAEAVTGYPIGSGACRTADGRLWFSTSGGLAVYDPRSPRHSEMPPSVHVVDMTARGVELNLLRPARLAPDSDRLQIRYSGIHLSAPERVQYSYRLEGLEKQWVSAGSRRLINYNSLPHGNYRFVVRASLPGGSGSEASYSFTLLPRYYETAWFRLLCALALAAFAWAVYQARLRQIRQRFSLVLEERARLAREIHDTLAQGFVGISSQLDAVALSMPAEDSAARRYLEMARRMARHSLTEARRSVMDLRASVLENQDFAAALSAGTRLWTAGVPVDVQVDVTGPQEKLPEDMEQHLLRIAQEAVTNVVKHAGARTILIKLHREARKLYLRIVDDGHGFEQGDAFSARVGHFGLIGMRERAQRLGGELRLASHPGEGTEVEVTVPLP
jgi:signal transduction histidine kinase/ligand-binding sensor domain-containing protein